MDNRTLLTFQGNREGWKDDVVREVEVFQALTYAPRAWPRLPVELF
jgi:hypothetical protein